MKGAAVLLLSTLMLAPGLQADSDDPGQGTQPQQQARPPQRTVQPPGAATPQRSAAAQQPQSKTSQQGAAPSQHPPVALYTVKEGNKVDLATLEGWKTWRALACERCHGAAQEGMVGPSLIESLKNLSKEEFHTTLMVGRPEKGMPPFSSSTMVQEHWEGLYAYLKGRSEGKIQPGRLSPIDQQ